MVRDKKRCLVSHNRKNVTPSRHLFISMQIISPMKEVTEVAWRSYVLVNYSQIILFILLTMCNTQFRTYIRPYFHFLVVTIINPHIVKSYCYNHIKNVINNSPVQLSIYLISFLFKTSNSYGNCIVLLCIYKLPREDYNNNREKNLKPLSLSSNQIKSSETTLGIF